MRASNPSSAFGMVLVDELVRHGLRHACIAPGSRSAPLALAFADDDRVRVHVRVDERSAAFLCLGIARATAKPVALVSTSGTAAANLHPAVVEASIGRVPVIVFTADRPPELRGTGANQTMDQLKLYGDAVRWFCEAGTPDEDRGAPRYWRSIAARAWAKASGPPSGPVHVNAALRAPLVPGDGAYPHDLSGRPRGAPWTAYTPRRAVPDDGVLDRVDSLVRAHERGVVIAGAPLGGGSEDAIVRFAAAAGYPLIAEPSSGARHGADAISCAEALLRTAPFAGEHRPEVVIRTGKTALSRAMTAFLEHDCHHVLIDPDAELLDPERRASLVVASDPEAAFGALASRKPRASSAWLDAWRGAETAARSAVDGVLDEADAPTEPRAARDLHAALPDGSILVAAASMPVRDLDWFAAPRTGVRVTGNRGANGIDGFVSTAVGTALVHDGPTAALCGDLSLIHDQNGFLTSGDHPDIAFVVINNDGGGIFSFLEQAGAPNQFEALFGTPHGLDLGAFAHLYGLTHEAIGRASDLAPAVEAALRDGGIRLLEVRTDRTANVEVHRRAFEAAATAVSHIRP